MYYNFVFISGTVSYLIRAVQTSYNLNGINVCYCVKAQNACICVSNTLLHMSLYVVILLLLLLQTNRYYPSTTYMLPYSFCQPFQHAKQCRGIFG